jgi:hypothetical protein
MPLIGTNWAAALFATATAILAAIILMAQAYAVQYVIEIMEEANDEPRR